MQPYNGSLFYKIYRALQDEGLEDGGMVFETNLTFISDLGFFTLRFEQEIPQVVHFLVWKNKRTWQNSIRFYREVKRILLRLGIAKFIASKPLKDNSFWTILFKLWGKDIKEYAVKDNQKFYIVNIGRNLR